MMKRTVLLFITVVFVSFSAVAQKGKVASAQSFRDGGKLKEALEAINLATDPDNPKAEKSIPWAKTWEVKGNIHQAIYNSGDESVKKMVSNPLQVALESYKKAIKLDENNKFEKSLKIKLTLLINDFSNQAISQYNEEKYADALKSFESVLEIQSLPVMIEKDQEQAVDTPIIFNAALTAYNAEKFDKAIEYYTQTAEYGYNAARSYLYLSRCYENKNDTITREKMLQKGFMAYPEDEALLFELINFYLLTVNDANKAMEYLDMAISKDDNNASIYFAKGTLLEKLERADEAIKVYLKAVEINPDYFDAYYNLGAIYYNKGVQQVDVTNAVPADEPEKYEEEKAKIDIEFKKAIPYLEKAIELKPDDKTVIETLKTLYYRLQMLDKFNEMKAKLDSMTE